MAMSKPGDIDAETVISKQELELEMLQNIKKLLNKDQIVPEPKVIAYQERLETEAEIAKRKEAAEKAAAADPKAKKKAPAKGAPADDPADKPQLL